MYLYMITAVKVRSFYMQNILSLKITMLQDFNSAGRVCKEDISCEADNGL